MILILIDKKNHSTFTQKYIAFRELAVTVVRGADSVRLRSLGSCLSEQKVNATACNTSLHYLDVLLSKVFSNFSFPKGKRCEVIFPDKLITTFQ